MLTLSTPSPGPQLARGERVALVHAAVAQHVPLRRHRPVNGTAFHDSLCALLFGQSELSRSARDAQLIHLVSRFADTLRHHTAELGRMEGGYCHLFPSHSARRRFQTHQLDRGAAGEAENGIDRSHNA